MFEGSRLQGEKMALLVSYSPVSSLPLSSPALALPTASDSRLNTRPVALRTRTLNGFGFRAPLVTRKSGVLAVRGISEAAESQPVVSDSDDDEDKLPFGNLPLESKLLQKLEHKIKMKLAKKVRLRRKKLVRKRRMRKKGRWPPSKMNKLKNV